VDHLAEIEAPLFLAVHVVADHPGRAVAGDDALTVVTGEAEQYGFVPCVGSLSLYSISCFHISLPSARAKHMTARFVLFSVACVMKTRSPQTTGVELPRSGRSTFQRTFSVALHLIGRFFSGEWPVPSGPRQAASYPRWPGGALHRTSRAARTKRGMAESSPVIGPDRLALFGLGPDL